MKFICLSGAEEETEVLKNEYKAAQRAGETRIGINHLFYRYFIKIKYLSLDMIERAYLRQESGESGEFLLMESYLMLKTRDGELHKFRMEREVYVREVLANFQENHPRIAIGFDGLK